jgi:hypothetical protein
MMRLLLWALGNPKNQIVMMVRSFKGKEQNRIMPRGASAKREKEYRELEREFKKEGRYKGREEEVAARIVNKQRSQFGETKSEKRKDRQGKSPDRNLPIKNYQHKTTDQVERDISKLSRSDLHKIERYEKQHKNRKTLLEAIHDRMSNGRSHDGHRSRSRTKSTSNRSHSKFRSGPSHARSRSSRSRSESTRSSRRHQSSRSRKSCRGDHNSHVTTDHGEIRNWVEERGGHPATVRRTESRGHQPGILRIDYPGYSGRESLEEISWDDFFDKFEKEKLAFLYQDETAGGDCSRFSKLIAR